MDNNLLAIEEYDFFDTDDAGSDFFDLFEERNPEADTGVGALKRIIGIDGNVHDSDFIRRGAEENNHAYGIAGTTVPVVGEQGLGLVIADADGEAGGGVFEARVAEFLK